MLKVMSARPGTLAGQQERNRRRGLLLVGVDAAPPLSSCVSHNCVYFRLNIVLKIQLIKCLHNAGGLSVVTRRHF